MHEVPLEDGEMNLYEKIDELHAQVYSEGLPIEVAVADLMGDFQISLGEAFRLIREGRAGLEARLTHWTCIKRPETRNEER